MKFWIKVAFLEFLSASPLRENCSGCILVFALGAPWSGLDTGSTSTLLPEWKLKNECQDDDSCFPSLIIIRNSYTCSYKISALNVQGILNHTYSYLHMFCPRKTAWYCSFSPVRFPEVRCAQLCMPCSYLLLHSRSQHLWLNCMHSVPGIINKYKS